MEKVSWADFVSNKGDDDLQKVFLGVKRIPSEPLRGMDISEQSKSVQDAVRSALGRVLDPEERRITILGNKLSGKTHFIELVAMNSRTMARRMNISPITFLEISESTINEILEVIPSLNSKDHGDFLSTIACNDLENICFITDSVRSAHAINQMFPGTRIIAESDPFSHDQMLHSNMALIKNSPLTWFEIDVSKLSFTKEEVVNALTQSILPRIERDFSIKFTPKDIKAFVKTTAEMTSVFEGSGDFQDENSSVPIGQWYEFARDVFREIILTGQESSGIRKVEEMTRILFDRSWGEDLSEYYDAEEVETSFGFPGMSMAPKAISGDEIAKMLGFSKNTAPEMDDTSDVDFKFRTIREIKRRLKKQIIGQDEAIDDLVKALSISVAGINDSSKPLNSFLFLGPTGVGKTKTAKVLSEELMTSPLPMLRIDMSEYGEEHEAIKLIGAPPSYVGFESGGVITNMVKKNPRSIVLLDEVEKAHPTVWDSFLQVLDAGRMTTPKGEVVDFSKTIIIMTSNLGAKDLNKASIGFSTFDDDSSKDKANRLVAKKAAREFFRPEFIGRIDAMINFKHLSKASILGVLKQEFKILANRSKERGYELSSPSNDILNVILAKSNADEFGAREIQSTVRNELFTPVASCMLDGKNKSGRIVLKLDSKNNVKAEMEASS